MPVEITETEWEALRAAINAGAVGCRLGREVAISTAIRMEMLGLCKLARADGAQIVVATSKGASAYRMRRMVA